MLENDVVSAACNSSFPSIDVKHEHSHASQLICPHCANSFSETELQDHILSCASRNLDIKRNNLVDEVNSTVMVTENFCAKSPSDVVPEHSSFFEKETFLSNLPQTTKSFLNMEDDKNLDEIDPNAFSTCMDLINSDKDLESIVQGIDSFDQIDNNYLPYIPPADPAEAFLSDNLCNDIQNEEKSMQDSAAYRKVNEVGNYNSDHELPLQQKKKLSVFDFTESKSVLQPILTKPQVSSTDNIPTNTSKISNEITFSTFAELFKGVMTENCPNEFEPNCQNEYESNCPDEFESTEMCLKHDPDLIGDDVNQSPLIESSSIYQNNPTYDDENVVQHDKVLDKSKAPKRKFNYNCSYCKKSYSSLYYVKKHILKFHPDLPIKHYKEQLSSRNDKQANHLKSKDGISSNRNSYQNTMNPHIPVSDHNVKLNFSISDVNESGTALPKGRVKGIIKNPQTKCKICGKCLTIMYLKKHMITQHKLSTENSSDLMKIEKETFLNSGNTDASENLLVDSASLLDSANVPSTSPLLEQDFDSSTCLSASDALKKNNSFTVAETSHYSENSDKLAQKTKVKFNFDVLEFSRDVESNSERTSGRSSPRGKHSHKSIQNSEQKTTLDDAIITKTIKQHSCHLCTKIFCSKDSLNRHLKNIHNPNKRKLIKKGENLNEKIPPRLCTDYQKNKHANSESLCVAEKEAVVPVSKELAKIEKVPNSMANVIQQNNGQDNAPHPNSKRNLLKAVLKSNFSKRNKLSRRGSKKRNSVQDEQIKFPDASQILETDSTSYDDLPTDHGCLLKNLPSSKPELKDSDKSSELVPLGISTLCQTSMNAQESSYSFKSHIDNELSTSTKVLNSASMDESKMDLNSHVKQNVIESQNFSVQSCEISPISQIISNVSKCHFGGTSNKKDKKEVFEDDSLKLLIPENKDIGNSKTMKDVKKKGKSNNIHFMQSITCTQNNDQDNINCGIDLNCDKNVSDLCNQDIKEEELSNKKVTNSTILLKDSDTCLKQTGETTSVTSLNCEIITSSAVENILQEKQSCVLGDTSPLNKSSDLRNTLSENESLKNILFVNDCCENENALLHNKAYNLKKVSCSKCYDIKHLSKNDSCEFESVLAKNRVSEDKNAISENRHREVENTIVKNGPSKVKNDMVEHKLNEVKNDMVDNTIMQNLSSEVVNDIRQNASTEVENDIVEYKLNRVENCMVSNGLKNVENAIMQNITSEVKNIHENRSSEVENATVKNGSSEVENATVKNGSSEFENASVKNESSEVENATVKNGSSEVENASVKNGSSEVENANVKNGSSEVENAIVKNGSREVENVIVMEGSSGVENSIIINGSTEVENFIGQNGSSGVENVIAENGSSAVYKTIDKNVSNEVEDVAKIRHSKAEIAIIENRTSEIENAMIENRTSEVENALLENGIVEVENALLENGIIEVENALLENRIIEVENAVLEIKTSAEIAIIENGTGEVIGDNGSSETENVIGDNGSSEPENVIGDNGSSESENVIADNRSSESEIVIADNRSSESENVIADNGSSESENVIGDNGSSECENIIDNNGSSEFENIIGDIRSSEVENGIIEIENAILEIETSEENVMIESGPSEEDETSEENGMIESGPSEEETAIVKNGTSEVINVMAKNGTSDVDNGMVKKVTREIENTMVQNESNEVENDKVKNRTVKDKNAVIETISKKVENDMVENKISKVDSAMVQNASNEIGMTENGSNKVEIFRTEKECTEVKNEISENTSCRVKNNMSDNASFEIENAISNSGSINVQNSMSDNKASTVENAMSENRSCAVEDTISENRSCASDATSESIYCTVEDELYENSSSVVEDVTSDNSFSAVEDAMSTNEFHRVEDTTSQNGSCNVEDGVTFSKNESCKLKTVMLDSEPYKSENVHGCKELYKLQCEVSSEPENVMPGNSSCEIEKSISKSSACESKNSESLDIESTLQENKTCELRDILIPNQSHTFPDSSPKTHDMQKDESSKVNNTFIENISEGENCFNKNNSFQKRKSHKIKSIKKKKELTKQKNTLSNPNSETMCRLCQQNLESMEILSKHLKDFHDIPVLKKHVSEHCNQKKSVHFKNIKLSPPNLKLGTNESDSESISDFDSLQGFSKTNDISVQYTPNKITIPGDNLPIISSPVKQNISDRKIDIQNLPSTLMGSFKLIENLNNSSKTRHLNMPLHKSRKHSFDNTDSTVSVKPSDNSEPLKFHLKHKLYKRGKRKSISLPFVKKVSPSTTPNQIECTNSSPVKNVCVKSALFEDASLSSINDSCENFRSSCDSSSSSSQNNAAPLNEITINSNFILPSPVPRICSKKMILKSKLSGRKIIIQRLKKLRKSKKKLKFTRKKIRSNKILKPITVTLKEATDVDKFLRTHQQPIVKLVRLKENEFDCLSNKKTNTISYVKCDKINMEAIVKLEKIDIAKGSNEVIIDKEQFVPDGLSVRSRKIIRNSRKNYLTLRNKADPTKVLQKDHLSDESIEISDEDSSDSVQFLKTVTKDEKLENTSEYTPATKKCFVLLNRLSK